MSAGVVVAGSWDRRTEGGVTTVASVIGMKAENSNWWVKEQSNWNDTVRGLMEGKCRKDKSRSCTRRTDVLGDTVEPVDPQNSTGMTGFPSFPVVEGP